MAGKTISEFDDAGNLLDTDYFIIDRGSMTLKLSGGNFTSLMTAISALSAQSMNTTSVTYSTPVTASGDFITVTVNNKQRLIRLWDHQ